MNVHNDCREREKNKSKYTDQYNIANCLQCSIVIVLRYKYHTNWYVKLKCIEHEWKELYEKINKNQKKEKKKPIQIAFIGSKRFNL